MTATGSNPEMPRQPWPMYRSKHRDRSHAAAHADSTSPGDENESANKPQSIEHAAIATAEPQMVRTADEFRELLEHLRTAKSFGYDSEFIGEHSYHPQLCVIQVATTERIALVDPLTIFDLTEFWKLLADPTIEKIVHAGQPDLEPVARHLNLPPRNVFDTQIVAGFAGLHYPIALGKLLAELTGKSLLQSSPNLKFSKWNARPLTPSQMRYAADDVRYMPMLREMLMQRLDAAGNAAWAIEECTSLSNMQLYIFDAASQRVRVRGVDKLSRRKTAVLRALVAWRDRAARQQNVPPRSLLKDEILHSLASSPPQFVEDLKQVQGLPRPVERQYGDEIVQITADALAAPVPNDAPIRAESTRMDRDTLRQRVEQLWDSIAERASSKGIEPALVTSKRELENVVRTIGLGRDTDHSRLFRGWRAQLLADILPRSA